MRSRSKAKGSDAPAEDGARRGLPPLYAPKLLEEKFSELPLCRILGGSASEGGTLQPKEGDVILLLPTLPNEGVKLLQQKSLAALFTVLGDESTKSWEAKHLTFRVVSLYEPVAVEEGCLTSLQGDLLLLIAHPRHNP